MAHNVAGLTVSLNEAERLEKDTATRLLKSRKLSLIVDLDQTLIHATIDPTVEEWINDENNVNHPTVKDIHKFVLSDSPTIYYIKLRPGLKEFLKNVSEFYEPHIYTMGTRNYASSVVEIIDPDHTIFNERILSRDESRNINQKNIRRLFPCDDSMVVAIDDRADVWGWSPNLIKVHPYDFFVGIGDINDTRFLKQVKSDEITSNKKTYEKNSDVKTSDEKTSDEITSDEKISDVKTSGVKTSDEETSGEKISGEETSDSSEVFSSEIFKKQQIEHEENEESISDPTRDRQLKSKPVLVDNDTELPNLLKALKEIHKRYYEEYDRQQMNEQSRTPDVTVLVPSMKAEVLKGVNILFTHVIPTSQKKESAEIWILAKEFGAECSDGWNSEVTHLVAGDRGTEKVKEAIRRGNVFIVRKEWHVI
ncbi:HAD-like domain-containing protein [Gigaspora rosea]|uniref:RNA polymerase II subunit A C-terminal domain phosphatase n=1 Tax=Gigaspora rosea TaxID=44941 RepID=A0A397UNJ5_9GLOM|nr:HAD-like domain-containing protein [Gigaspora rosea]